MEFLTKIFKQIKDFILGLPPARKLALIGTGVGIIAAISGLLIWASHQAYQPVTYGQLNPEDSTNIMRLLREKHIPFEVDPQGKSITVPPEYLHDLRLELAMQGMPQSSGVGYELFDKQAFGTTTFLNKVNQKRALEGELMRSINSIKGVKRSRIHLAIPEKTAFVEDQKKPSASVVLDLDPGTTLNEKQIYGIGHLISSAVEGLELSQVVIVDSFGKPLSKNTHDSLVAMTSEQQEYKKKLEEEKEKTIEDLIGKVVGAGHVKVAVTADLDFSTVSEQQTLLDQDGATIRNKQVNNESAEGSRPGAPPAPGAISNTPGEQTPPVQAQGTKSNTNHTNEITNYEIPKTIKTTQHQVGAVKKLSVAVVLDNRQVKSTNADGKTEMKSEAWSKDKMAEFEALITGSLALDKKRGDTLELKTMEFATEDFEEAQKILDATAMRGYVQTLVTYGIIGIIIVLFFFFVVRPYIRWVTENTTDSVDTFLPQTIEELEKIQKSSQVAQLEEVVPDIPDRLDPEKVEGDMIREKIVGLIDNNPQKGALIMKEWLLQGRSNGAAAEREKNDKTA